ncbi:histidine kinase dimerization/phosphoacceptor domain-containing protein [Streptomyces mirabilis]|nr:histidine kinase dimerization/phosphoacceptor domain-containing protein [Streptomyces mirabilis]
MIAVQAETARLTTAGLPADGATRLLAIGDTARTALTEMRRLLGCCGRTPTQRSTGVRSRGCASSWSSSTSPGTPPAPVRG